MSPSRIRTVVIGCGPSGLVALKTIQEQPDFQVVCALEASDAIGGTFVNKAYDDCRLVSSKYITAFSDFRFPRDESDHPTVRSYVKYLEDYSELHGLNDLIRFRCRVTRVVRAATRGYVVYYQDSLGEAKDVACDAVVVCSGLHNVPFVPDTFVDVLEQSQLSGNHGDQHLLGPDGEHMLGPDDEHVLGRDGKRLLGRDDKRAKSNSQSATTGYVTGHSFQAIHSSSFKNVTQVQGKRLLLVGCGETSMDIAAKAVHARCPKVGMVVRNGFLSVPTSIGADGIALDTLITNLFECSYQHPLVESLHIKWAITTVFIRLGFLLATGSSCGYHQYVGGLKTVRRGYHIINKQPAAMPFMNRAFRRKHPLWGWLFSYLDPTEIDDPTLPDITVHPAVQKVDMTGDVTFENGQTSQFDCLLLCTGYRQWFPFLDHNSRAFSPDAALSQRTETQHSRLPSVRNIVNPDEPWLPFIGFVRPNVGAIPPMAELQIQWWIHWIRKGQPSDLCPPTYELLGQNQRTKGYACDYGLYMHDLARDMGAAPDLLRDPVFLSNPRTLLAYCLGQAYVPFFRIQGPFMDPKRMLNVTDGELFDTIKKRGIVTNIGLMLTVVAFGMLNLYAWLLDTGLSFVGIRLQTGRIAKTVETGSIPAKV